MKFTNCPTSEEHMKNVEECKERFNLRPALEFVERHRHHYEIAVNLLLRRHPYSDPDISRVQFKNTELISGNELQIAPDEAGKILARLSVSLLQLSCLQTVDYEFAGIVPVPVFNDDGVWGGSVDTVPVAQFPRENDHPSRILIGRSTGEVIYPSALPASVHEDKRARWMYQLHVFLHEFFHTIELPRRNPEIRKQILFFRDNTPVFTFQNWWERWENLFLGATKPRFPSRYAGSYAEFLTSELRGTDRGAFDRALAEQICESFVGYILGIVPNDENISSFREHSPEAWGLFHELSMMRIV